MAKAKYFDVVRVIYSRIKDGTYHPGKPLPKQEVLAKELGVSRLTVKKALDGLERKGLVFKQSGLGTFVPDDIPIHSSIDSPATLFTGLENLMGADNVKSKIIVFSVELPSKAIKKNLSLKKGELVYDIFRLRIVNDQPFTLERTYIPVNLVPDLNKNVLHSSIYNYIHQQLKLKFGHAYRKIRASKSNQYDEKYLLAKKDDPILELEQIIWLTNGKPIEYSTSRNRYDQRIYTITENTKF